jgi:hypothetical protein
MDDAVPSCDVRLRIAVNAFSACVGNATFGCQSPTSMFVQGGCRGTFVCNGNRTGLCGPPEGGRRMPLHRIVCACLEDVDERRRANAHWWAAFRNRTAERRTKREQSDGIMQKAVWHLRVGNATTERIDPALVTDAACTVTEPQPPQHHYPLLVALSTYSARRWMAELAARTWLRRVPYLVTRHGSHSAQRPCHPWRPRTGHEGAPEAAQRRRRRRRRWTDLKHGSQRGVVSGGCHQQRPVCPLTA